MLYASVLDYIRSFATCRSIMAVTVFTLTLRTNATLSGNTSTILPILQSFRGAFLSKIKTSPTWILSKFLFGCNHFWRS